MKKYLLTSLLFSIIFSGIAYLWGSFANATFDINNWTIQCRALVAFIGGFASIGSFIANLIYDKGGYK